MKKHTTLKYTSFLILTIVLMYIHIDRNNTANNQTYIQNTASDIFNSNIIKASEIEVEQNKVAETNPEPIIREQFLLLREEFNNNDIVGYLSIENTSIDYPVVQYSDNFYYLEHDLYKNKSNAGSIYLDFENDLTGNDYNTVIYGHNMRDNIMFHDLRYYNAKSFYDEHKYINYSTLYNDYVYEIFSVYETSIDFPYITVNFDSEESFYTLSKQFKEKSIYNTNVNLEPSDKVITLSTCTSLSLDSDKRFVVHGKLISIDGVLLN